jgi:hypothetical protein
MLIKQEALNVAFSSAAFVPPPNSVGGTLSTSSVTSSPSRHPSLGAHGRMSVALSRFGDLRPTSSGSAGPAIDLNRASTGDTTWVGMKKPHRISSADIPRAVNLFDDMPE